MWEEVGQLQFDFLVKSGLKPDHRMIDVGCGSLRGGVHFAQYLDSGHYFGIDINQSLIDAGYEKELKPRGLDRRVPRANLRASSEFDFAAFEQVFDYALAVSVFTHLPLDTIRICLERLAPAMSPTGVFFATVFENDPEQPSVPVLQEPGGVTTYSDQDPYHYGRDDLIDRATACGWKTEWIGDFGHPRNQKMVRFQVG